MAQRRVEDKEEVGGSSVRPATVFLKFRPVYY